MARIAAPHPIGILATGSYLPETEVSSATVADRAGVTAEWIERKTEIRTRRHAAATQATSDLATQAARNALEQVGLSAAEIDYIIVATSTGDSPQPPTACLVQSALRAHRAACFDINVVCAGFVYGIGLAQALVALRPQTRALVVAADLYSRIIDYRDRGTSVLLGDGAGAAIVGTVTDPYGLIDIKLSSRGEAHRHIRVEAGGSRMPTSAETVAAGGHYFKMEGREVRDFVMRHVPQVIADVAGSAGLRLDEIDHFVPHQANGVLLRQLTLLSGLATAQTHRTLEKYGNMGSASVAVTLDEANRSGAIQDGQLVLLTAFGGGMSIGAGLLRWSAPGAPSAATT